MEAAWLIGLRWRIYPNRSLHDLIFKYNLRRSIATSLIPIARRRGDRLARAPKGRLRLVGTLVLPLRYLVRSLPRPLLQAEYRNIIAHRIR